MDVQEFFKLLEKYRAHMTRQQYKTVRGQAYKGDILGALRGIKTIMER